VIAAAVAARECVGLVVAIEGDDDKRTFRTLLDALDALTNERRKG